MTAETRRYRDLARSEPQPGRRSPFGLLLGAMIAADDSDDGPPPEACLLDLMDRGKSTGMVDDHLRTVERGQRTETDMWTEVLERLET